MAMTIAILEDNQERQAIMADCLADRFHQFNHRFFNQTRDLIAYLNQCLEEVILLSLDHDLELIPTKNGKCNDPGCGREVADFLAHIAPRFPVVIHSTNADAAFGMGVVLQEAGWQTVRVVPSDDLEWIPKQWFRAVRNAIVKSAKPVTDSSVGIV